MVSSRLSIISNSAFVVVGISALHAVAIVAIALLEADCTSFKAARCAAVGRPPCSPHRLDPPHLPVAQADRTRGAPPFKSARAHGSGPGQHARNEDDGVLVFRRGR